MKSPKSQIRNPNEAGSPKSETGLRGARSVLECGSALPLSLPATTPPSGQSARGRAHSKTWRAILTFAVLSAGLCLPALAQFATWYTVDGGGGTSTGGVYSVSGTIGQPDAGGPMSGGGFSLTGGFWALPQVVHTPGAPTLYITNAAPGWATLWWTPATDTNWVLQERLSLNAGAWTNAPSGPTNPVTVPATLPTKFYRLFKP